MNVHETEATKLCRGCGRLLPLDAFYVNRVPGGRFLRCRDCRRAAGMAYVAGFGQTEKSFQRQIIDLAHLLGWKVFHPWLSLKSPSGFPDLVMVRPPRVVFAELKTRRYRVTEAQQEWLTLLQACPGVEAYVWRPDDWDEIVRVLERRD